MEFLMELIFEIFVEGSIYLADDKTVPRWLRITALTIVTVFYLVFTVFFIIVFIEYEDVFCRVIFGGCILLFVGMLGKLWYRMCKKSHNR